MKRYPILQPAKEKLREASRWYEEQREGLGQALIDEFEERLALALDRPQAGAIVGSTTQGTPIRRHRLRRRRRHFASLRFPEHLLLVSYVPVPFSGDISSEWAFG